VAFPPAGGAPPRRPGAVTGGGPGEGPLVLALDAATPAASVAVLRGRRVLAERAAAMRPGADDALMPAVDAALLAAGLRPGDLAAVVCGAGPGGFTSLRIAGALAKGLAHATGCALVAFRRSRSPRPAPRPTVRRACAAGSSRSTRCAASGTPRRWARRAPATSCGSPTTATSACTPPTVRRPPTAGVRRTPAVRPGASGPDPVHVDAHATPPLAAGVRAFALALARGGSGEGADAGAMMLGAVDLHAWEPEYGRQAEAQARWESAHGRPLAAALAPTAAVAGPAGDA
jgi:tRNA threonylcarbamoyladenosine biosynthesis protein TsaB